MLLHCWNSNSHSVDGFVGDTRKPSDVKEMPHSWDRFAFNPGKWKPVGMLFLPMPMEKIVKV